MVAGTPNRHLGPLILIFMSCWTLFLAFVTSAAFRYFGPLLGGAPNLLGGTARL
jgi:hypothetical protein